MKKIWQKVTDFIRRLNGACTILTKLEQLGLQLQLVQEEITEKLEGLKEKEQAAEEQVTEELAEDAGDPVKEEETDETEYVAVTAPMFAAALKCLPDPAEVTEEYIAGVNADKGTVMRFEDTDGVRRRCTLTDLFVDESGTITAGVTVSTYGTVIVFMTDITSDGKVTYWELEKTNVVVVGETAFNKLIGRVAEETTEEEAVQEETVEDEALVGEETMEWTEQPVSEETQGWMEQTAQTETPEADVQEQAVQEETVTEDTQEETEKKAE